MCARDALIPRERGRWLKALRRRRRERERGHVHGLQLPALQWFLGDLCSFRLSFFAKVLQGLCLSQVGSFFEHVTNSMAEFSISVLQHESIHMLTLLMLALQWLVLESVTGIEMYMHVYVYMYIYIYSTAHVIRPLFPVSRVNLIRFSRAKRIWDTP